MPPAHRLRFLRGKPTRASSSRQEVDESRRLIQRPPRLRTCYDKVMALSRRVFLTLPAACYAETAGKGRMFGAAITRYADPATEFPVSRLTDPKYSSHLPAYPNRTIARNGSFLLYSSDITGRFEAFRLDLKTGQSKQL